MPRARARRLRRNLYRAYRFESPADPQRDELAAAHEALAWDDAVSHLRCALGVDVSWCVPDRHRDLQDDLRVAWRTADVDGRAALERLAAAIESLGGAA